MFSTLKALWQRLAGAGGGVAEPDIPAVEYKGFRIRPAPYPTNGQYQTAGFIEKEVGGEVKSHRFVRADTDASRDDAIATTIVKAKRIIDERGDNMFA